MPDLERIEEFRRPTGEEDAAKQEASALFNEHRRTQRAKNVLNWIFVVFMSVIGGVFILAVGIWVTHLALPVSWQWLSTAQREEIQKLFTSGVVGGAIFAYYRKVNT